MSNASNSVIHVFDRNCHKRDRQERARYLDGSNAKYVGKWDGFFFAFGQFRPATVTVGIAEGSTDDATVLERSVGRGGALAGGWFSAIVKLFCESVSLTPL